jgi:hypothetical protein
MDNSAMKINALMKKTDTSISYQDTRQESRQRFDDLVMGKDKVC